MQTDYLVLKWSDVEEHLSDEELETFYGYIAQITNETPDESHLVISSEAPYAGRVQELMKEDEPVLTKAEAIATLNELVEADPEIAHSEADEILLRLVNDKDVEKAYDEVPKWYA